MRQKNAYLTVYLCISLTLILSIYLTLIEGARRNGSRLEAACISETSLNSIMAEYSRELAKRYGIYAIDTGYGTNRSGVNNAEAHLLKFLRENQNVDEVFLGDLLYKDFFGLQTVDAEIEKVEILTDNGGAVFRKQAEKVLGNDTGLNLFGKVQQWVSVIQVNGYDTADPEEQISELQEELSEVLHPEADISEVKLLDIPADHLLGKLSTRSTEGLIGRVIEEKETLSLNYIDTTYLFTNRKKRGEVSVGNWEMTESNLIDKYFFQEYLLRYLASFSESKEDTALQYQIEYLIGGKPADIDNLKSVFRRILLIREAANAAYLFGDEAKKEEVEVVATLVCSAVGVPEAAPALEALLIGLWAEIESEYDLKCLAKGKKVPLLKNEESWHYALKQIFSGKDSKDDEESDGLSYTDYLRVLMSLCNVEILTDRALDMIEADIRLTEGNAAFRTDACYTRVQASIRFRDCKGCNYEVTRTRKY